MWMQPASANFAENRNTRQCFFKPMENITISDAYIYICIDTSIYDDIIDKYILCMIREKQTNIHQTATQAATSSRSLSKARFKRDRAFAIRP